ncbi:MAG: hypothetical protein JM58_01740 [Peptococcaceae bacterium BICA1-8]|nr:MAG: hypothetical protein JM58_01740 [Peptococcaceae bacterium BICA1-8]
MNFYAPWDIRVTLDFFLGGLGIGAFLFAALLSFYDRKRYREMIKISAYIAPISIILGLLALITELGKPARFITTIFRFNPSSVMSWGVFLQSGFVLFALIFAYLIMKNKEDSGMTDLTLILGSLLALAVGLYQGLLLSANVGRSLWSGGLVPVMFLFSSILTGTAVVLLICSLKVSTVSNVTQRETATVDGQSKDFSFTGLLFGLIVANITIVLVWFISLNKGTLETQKALDYLISNHGIIWWGGVIIVGLLIPLVLVLSQLNKRKNNLTTTPIISALILFGGFVLKHIVLIVGQVRFPFL